MSSSAYTWMNKGLDYIALINPDDFVRWIFPRLFRARIPRYEDIAARHGYTVATDEILAVKSENDFIDSYCRRAGPAGQLNHAAGS